MSGGGWGEEGAGNGAPAMRDEKREADGSFHSPAYQKAFLSSLTEIKRDTWEEYMIKQKEKEGKLAAAEATTEEETKAFRLELEKDRAKRLAVGLNNQKSVLGVKSKKMKKDKKKKKSKDKSSKKEKKEKGEKGEKEKNNKKDSKKSSKKSMKSSGSSSSGSRSSDSEMEKEGGGDDPTDKYRLSGFFT
mmetsp:Transcript_41483/g.102226  ORF Transcript_41483/g.102226 Transcript_41483/m.102226 type:complete len:189 (+) Transcript_41483:120-686(+)|eukprot:CAMPEP_0197578488 /NCGR_PEP_ID=MMETSP1326-20131121/2676_1 /TAXON_ID=1155430 /ORGANISM="Genus nov. species nov., Strain RCC2288" /LENGTH=188 /DNA_ID=CAMNT_0043141671 /DNA_START=112 /DNA_END=678 /DNA_ORIENTATION=+